MLNRGDFWTPAVVLLIKSRAHVVAELTNTRLARTPVIVARIPIRSRGDMGNSLTVGCMTQRTSTPYS